ncbi:ABC transporter ATP-binding protein [Acetitomaculum ruminis]|nr:ATP-binding cassette domain-containing protein [Acetitomaculum ruminis]
MAEKVLETVDLVKIFKDSYEVKALDNVSCFVEAGEILGVVGESGSGKSTLARAVTRLINVDSGSIILNGNDITGLKGKEMRKIYNDIQMVFQDAVSSFDARLTIEKNIDEVLENFTSLNRKQRKEKIKQLLRTVGLKEEYLTRKPLELSGGECQRAAIARAIATNPKLLICDEATSALDVSMQAQIVKMLKKLAVELNIAILFISHDLAIVNGLCDRVLVMYHGKVVESGKATEVICNPQDDYTKKLKASVFI